MEEWRERERERERKGGKNGRRKKSEEKEERRGARELGKAFWSGAAGVRARVVRLPLPSSLPSPLSLSLSLSLSLPLSPRGPVRYLISVARSCLPVIRRPQCHTVRRICEETKVRGESSGNRRGIVGGSTTGKFQGL
jgi:hypothetical protein